MVVPNGQTTSLNFQLEYTSPSNSAADYNSGLFSPWKAWSVSGAEGSKGFYMQKPSLKSGFQVGRTRCFDPLLAQRCCRYSSRAQFVEGWRGSFQSAEGDMRLGMGSSLRTVFQGAEGDPRLLMGSSLYHHFSAAEGSKLLMMKSPLVKTFRMQGAPADTTIELLTCDAVQPCTDARLFRGTADGGLITIDFGDLQEVVKLKVTGVAGDVRLQYTDDPNAELSDADEEFFTPTCVEPCTSHVEGAKKFYFQKPIHYQGTFQFSEGHNLMMRSKDASCDPMPPHSHTYPVSMLRAHLRVCAQLDLAPALPIRCRVRKLSRRNFDEPFYATGGFQQADEGLHPRAQIQGNGGTWRHH